MTDLSVMDMDAPYVHGAIWWECRECPDPPLEEISLVPADPEDPTVAW